MRGRRMITALLACAAVTACGSGSDKDVSKPSSGHAVVSPTAATPIPDEKATSDGPDLSVAKKARAKPSVVRATYVGPSKHLATKSGKDPAVVLLPDTANQAAASAEAKKLAALGIGAFVVVGPPATPAKPTDFNRAVDTALAAVQMLRQRADVDPYRIGFIGEGVGAHVGAVAIGRAPDAIAAAVLADIGGVVVPSAKFAPERWLSRAGGGLQLLFQRDLGKRAMTTAEIKRLMLAAPPGTLMEQYNDLGTAAEASRDSWIKKKLLAF